MRVTQDQMQENRRRILTEASRLFREKGFDAVSVAEVMKAAGLTHGGFYGHFSSKEDLMAQAIASVVKDVADRAAIFPSFLRAYLSPTHRDDVKDGCPVAALAADIRLRPESARSAMSAGIRLQIERMQAALPDNGMADRRCDAIGVYAAMIGAVVLARAVDDLPLSDDILAGTRDWIEASLKKEVQP